MGLSDYLTGSNPVPKGVARKPATELRAGLLAMNRDTAPFVIRDGADADCDLLAEWRAGVPSLTLAGSAFRGQKREMSFGVAVGFREDLSFGKIYEYKFNSQEMKQPLKEAILESGWGWRGLILGKL